LVRPGRREGPCNSLNSSQRIARSRTEVAKEPE
jgi:hypothetical protein